MEEYLNYAVQLLIDYAPKVLGALVTLVIGFWLAKIIANKVKTALEKRDVDPSLVPFLRVLISVLIKVLVLISAAGLFGIEVTSFIAILSALAFAIGLALQGQLSHFAAGILILSIKPFKVGNFIKTNGYGGTVQEINIFNTILTTLDNRVVIIPNGNITSNPLENFSVKDIRRLPLTFGVSYDADLDKVREVIQEVIDDCDMVLHDQGVDIKVSELADSSVNFIVRPWCNAADYWPLNFHLQETIKKEFDKAGIGIPYPQMDVHMSKND